MLTAVVVCTLAFANDGDLAEVGRVFYVNSADGDDARDGRSAEAAWRSLGRVNAAELKPGDTVRFQRGGRWRGSLRPARGEPSAPVTYTSYGDGPKPLLLGSRPRSRPEDWVEVEDGIWATLPMEYRRGELLADLRSGRWRHHQEAGARVALAEEDAEGGRIVKITCDGSGQASNHVQLWGPAVAVEEGTTLEITFLARCSKPFPMPRIAILEGSSPWTGCGSATAAGSIGTEWQTFRAILRVSRSSRSGRLHIRLGGILPAGAVFELRPQDLYAVTANIADPLCVDVGNIIFDHGKVCGWKKWSVEALENPYDYFYDGSAWRVFLRAEANPAALHESIELAMAGHVVNQGGAHHVVYDGLAVMYGASHGFGGGGTHHLVIRNCDLGYIGGAHQHTVNGRPVRFGNAIEFWGAAHDNLVEGCRIWQVYDAALTNQGRSPDSRQVNITYRNNFIRNAEYSFEYWNHPETALTENIRFVNNTCVEAGVVWSHAQRPDRNGSQLMFYSNTAATSGIEVKYNIFYNHTEWGSRYDRGWKTLPEVDYNLWFSRDGVIARWFGKSLAGFADYQRTTGLDPHSVFADPQFVDPQGGDYRLAPGSPAHRLRPDGGPVGADHQ
ncbi:MAG: hypothetical protein PHO07_19510 [Pirellulales bacterium]|jgi:hypothetical protein|nr:hypothetical protein [Thermoguttaceae bacterium]MDD4789363.1 hypothetical protein [Pirellulales bacterium]MDI9446307.1 hypothetical protein [Planctomycetota bacterium]NLZ01638.1 hypothetical protein [Pirellulaceae bacterium]